MAAGEPSPEMSTTGRESGRDAGRGEHLEYFNSKQEELEWALSAAVRHAVSELHPDPIACVTQHLQQHMANRRGGVGAGAGAAAAHGASAGDSSTSTAARAVTAERVAEVVGALRFKSEYVGQLVPPKPTAEELAAGATTAGPLENHGGVVLQGGPFGSVWLRVGCVPDVPWLTLWETLKCYIEHTIALQREVSDAGTRPGSIYCAVSFGASQAIDLSWLAARGFKFYHYREAEEEEGPALATAAELIFYCWPGGPQHHDLVPAYATSIEGASGVVLSPDGEQVLLAWERGCWRCPAGAVNPGEGALEALVREAYEELKVDVDLDDPSHPPLFIGGYNKSRARDGKVNDNFHTWVVRAKSMEFQVDGDEVHLARWFKWKELVEAWQADGSPGGWEYNLPDRLAAEGHASIDGKLLPWLLAHQEGRGLRCAVEVKTQGRITKRTVTIGV